MAGSNTTRCMEEARKRGWSVGVVERYIHARRIRIDYLGIIDLIAISNNTTIGIQACSGTDHAAHRTKCLGNINTLLWVKSPSRRLVIWSWRKKKIKRGGIAYRWHLREDTVTYSEAFGALKDTSQYAEYIAASFPTDGERVPHS